MAEPSGWRFNSSAYKRFVHDLDLADDQVLLEYIYIGDDGETMACKCRKVDKCPESIDDVPVWNFAANFPVEDRFLKPVAMYKDPFRRGPHRLVLCEVLANDWTPAYRNFRAGCVEIMGCSQVEAQVPWFGLEQEYTMLDGHGLPVGWPNRYMPEPPLPTHHDAVGMHVTFGRDLYEAHLFACMYAGVNISGGNAEACAGQWEFQVGPSVGVKACDDLWMGRYLLHRLSEEFNMAVTFKPKPVTSSFYANGGHTNFSTLAMREEGGLDVIKECLPRLENTHAQFLPLCDAKGGEDNQGRLTGHYCQAPKDFSWGIEDRDAAIRISRQVEHEGKGFLEDRRPASNFDPYLVTSALVQVIILKVDTLRNPYIEPRIPKLAIDPEVKANKKKGNQSS